MRLTLRDKHTLRQMLSAACSHLKHEQTCHHLNYRDADETSTRFEKALAKVVPIGILPKLRPRKAVRL